MLGSGKVSIVVLNAYAHAKYITRLSNADDHDRLVLRVQLRTAEPAEQAKLAHGRETYGAHPGEGKYCAFVTKKTAKRQLIRWYYQRFPKVGLQCIQYGIRIGPFANGSLVSVSKTLLELRYWSGRMTPNERGSR